VGQLPMVLDGYVVWPKFTDPSIGM